MTILLVGNSAKLLEKPYRGVVIDSFGTVVRFNGGNPARHPEQLGERTDYWSFSTKNAQEVEDWQIPGARPMCLNMRIDYPVWLADSVYNTRENYDHLIEDYGHPRPSTGLITAHYITRNWEGDVYCIGFDFFGSDTWYRGSNANIPHDGDREREYMKTLGVSVL